jgi:hypothetical protein
MGQSWSKEEDQVLMSLMDYVPGRDIPVLPALPSWKHVASRMTFLYLEAGRDPPRRYTDDIVSTRWNNDIMPRLLAAAYAPVLHIEVPSPPHEKAPPPYEEEALPRYEETQGRTGLREKEG